MFYTSGLFIETGRLVRHARKMYYGFIPLSTINLTHNIENYLQWQLSNPQRMALNIAFLLLFFSMWVLWYGLIERYFRWFGHRHKFDSDTVAENVTQFADEESMNEVLTNKELTNKKPINQDLTEKDASDKKR